MKRATTRFVLNDNGGQPVFSKAVQDAAEKVTKSVYIGPGWWLLIHLLARCTDKFATIKAGKVYRKTFLYIVNFTIQYFKALECKNHFADFAKAYPPEKAPSLYVWSVNAHNEVNKRNGKHVYTVEEATEALSGEHDYKIVGIGGWAILHQTAYHAMMDPKYLEDARNIHTYIASRTEFGNYYKIEGELPASLFSYSVMKHTQCGGMKLTIPEASYIWGPDNVNEEPCSGPAPIQNKHAAIEEEDDEIVYDVVPDEDENSDVEENGGDVGEEYDGEGKPAFITIGFFNNLFSAYR